MPQVKDILLYGDIVPFIVNAKSEIDMHTLHDRVTEANLSHEDTLRVNINTLGGCTTTAFAMYNYLRRLVNDGKVAKVITRIDGWCASSGVIILLAGDERVGNAYAEPFVHKAWTYVDSGNSNELQKKSEDLTKTDNQIATLYSKRTTITVEQALAYMAADTWVSVDECLKLGFYTSLENVEGVEASRNVFNSLRQTRQTKVNSKTAKDMSKKPKGLLNQMLALIQGAQNKIIKDAAGVDVDFYELEDGATPSVGDKALVDGQPAGDYNGGVITMADGQIFNFTGEELTSITPADDTEPKDEAEDDEDEKDAEIARLKAELEAANAAKDSATTSLNKMKAKYNKAKTEGAEAINVLTKINSIKDKHVREVLSQIDEDVEDVDTDDDEEDDEEDENGFPKGANQRVNNSVSNKKKTKSDGESTSDILKSMTQNMFAGMRK